MEQGHYSRVYSCSVDQEILRHIVKWMVPLSPSQQLTRRIDSSLSHSISLEIHLYLWSSLKWDLPLRFKICNICIKTFLESGTILKFVAVIPWTTLRGIKAKTTLKNENQVSGNCIYSIPLWTWKENIRSRKTSPHSYQWNLTGQ
jgi:hypothetical protein